MQRPRLSTWLGSPFGEPAQALIPDKKEAHVLGLDYLLSALRTRQPNQNLGSNIPELVKHFTSAPYLAINTLARQAASADHGVYEIADDPEESDEKLHASEYVCELLQEPNNEDSWPELIYQIVQQLKLSGMAILWTPMVEGMRAPNELYVLPTVSCLPMPPNEEYPNGFLSVLPYYTYGVFAAIPSYQAAAGNRVPMEQIIIIKDQHPYLRYSGYAVLTALRAQVDTIDYCDTSRLQSFRQGINPTLMVEFDPEILDPTDEAIVRFRQNLENLYAGVLNDSSILFSPVGTKIQPVSRSNVEMAYTEGWAQLVEFVMAGYGTPNVVAGLSQADSYATVFAALKQFYIISLQPMLDQIASKINKHLIRPYFGNNLILKIEAKKFNDEELQIKQIQATGSLKVWKVNELRKVLGLNADNSSYGDSYVDTTKVSVREEAKLPDSTNLTAQGVL